MFLLASFLGCQLRCFGRRLRECYNRPVCFIPAIPRRFGNNVNIVVVVVVAAAAVVVVAAITVAAIVAVVAVVVVIC